MYLLPVMYYSVTSFNVVIYVTGTTHININISDLAKRLCNSWVVNEMR